MKLTKVFTIVILFFPLISFAQVKTYKELKNLNSIEKFHKLCIETGFRLRENGEGDSFYTIYYLGDDYSAGFIDNPPDYDSEYDYGEWFFNFFTKKAVVTYNKIFNEVKKQCNFRKITNVRNSKVKMSCYSCPDSRYKGLICFYKESTMFGELSTIVHHIEN